MMARIVGRRPQGKRMFLLAAGTGALLTLTGSFMLVSVALNVGAGADTAPYELYCPGTPVGTIVLNGVQTTGELSPAAPTAGTQFDVVNYQTTLDIPSAIVTAAAALGNTAITGSATTTLDATGATPATMVSPELSFDVTIPDPVPSSGLTVSVPSSPATVGPFTATSSDVTIAQDSSTALTLVVSGDDLSLTCTAYPNNSAPTGISSSVPTASPISPVVAESGSSTAPTGTLESATTACVGASSCSFTLTGEDFGSDEAVDLTLGSGTTSPGSTSLGTAMTDDNGVFSAEVTIPSSTAAGTYTITAVGETSGTVGTLAITISAPSTGLTGAYQLYCPGTPVGDVVLNDVTTSAAIAPTSPTAGSSFNVTNYQTQVSIPTALAVAAYALDPTALSGTAEASIDLAGATPTSMSAGTLSFSVPFTATPTAPVPVDLPSTPATLGPFTATSTDVTVAEDPNASLTLDVAGAQVSLVCTAFPNDTPDFNTTNGYVGTGEPPASEAIAPVIAIAGGGSTTPPSTTTTTTTPGSTTTTIPTGPSGEYELYCPGTPVGTVVLNDVVTTASISPASPAVGSLFNVTDFQVQAELPASLATAAAALGNTSISGSATATLDASGATPASLDTPTLPFDVPIPSPIPSGGLAFAVPTSPETIGPFTAGAGNIAISQATRTDIALVVSGNTIDLNCTTYNNNSAPSGITTTEPSGDTISPVIATATSQSATTTTTTTTTAPPVLMITSAECAPGCQLGLSGSGFQPEETVALMLNPAGSSLGQATADESGNISATVTIPTGTSAGDYTVVAQGESSGDTATVPVTVTAATAPTTSTPTTSSTTTSPTTTSSTTPSSTTTSSTTTTTAPGATTSTTAGPTTTAAPAVADASATSVAASSSGLAFTGAGPGIRLTAIIGSSLLLFGLLLLLVIDTPKLLMRRLARRKT